MYKLFLTGLILPLFLNVFAKETGRFDDAIAIIKNNKTFIKSKIKPVEVNDKVIADICDAKNDSAKKNAIASYLVSIQEYSSSITGNSAITDTMHIKFLSVLLTCGDEDLERSAYSKLEQCTVFEVLKDNSALLKDRLYKSKTIPDYLKYKLMAWLNPTKAEIDTICKYNKGDPYGTKAAFDSVALDTLIEHYDSKDYSNYKRTIAFQLLQTGQKKAVQAVLKDVFLPPYDVITYRSCAKCTTSAYQKDVIIELRRYHKVDTLLNKKFNAFYENLFKRDTTSLRMANAYWKDLKNWAKRNYDVAIPEQMPFSTFFLSCYPLIGHSPINCE